MGLSGLSFGEILLILVVLLVLFGSKKLPGIASDLGNAIRDFQRSISGSREPAEPTANQHPDQAAAPRSAPPTPASSGADATSTPETSPRDRAP